MAEVMQDGNLVRKQLRPQNKGTFADPQGAAAREADGLWCVVHYLGTTQSRKQRSAVQIARCC